MVSPGNSSMFAEERKLKIVEILNHNKKVTVAELCEVFDVSSATIRNDLRELDESGQLIRTHGGAIIKTKASFEPDSTQKRDLNVVEKQRIAQVAINLIEDGDTIILDTGTTTLELAKLLNQKKNLTVVTNDFYIASVIEEFDTIHIILMGGIVKKKFHCTVELPGKETLAGLRVDKAFVGTNSLSLENGATTPDVTLAATKKHMIASASKVILLCSNKKVGKTSFAQFASVDQIDTLVIDEIREKMKKELEEYDIDVIEALSDKSDKKES